jgi:hypothetical protein
LRTILAMRRREAPGLPEGNRASAPSRFGFEISPEQPAALRTEDLLRGPSSMTLPHLLHRPSRPHQLGSCSSLLGHRQLTLTTQPRDSWAFCHDQRPLRTVRDTLCA